MSHDPTSDRRSPRSGRLDAALDELRRDIRSHPVPDLVSGVMSRLEAAPSAAPRSGVRAALGRLVAWLWAPRPLRLQLRPAYAVALGAALLVVLPLAPDRGPAAPEPAPRVYVQFRLEAPGAHEVALAGTFTGWEPALELREVSPGVWSAVVPVEPGVHDYTFLVDGTRWVVDPNAPQVDDAFGGRNNRLPVPDPSVRA